MPCPCTELKVTQFWMTSLRTHPAWEGGLWFCYEHQTGNTYSFSCMSDRELPNYVHEKVNVIEITDMEMSRWLKGVKRREHQDRTDGMRAEMVDVAREIGARWIKRLLKTCSDGRCGRRDWSQMDKEAVENMHETMQSAGNWQMGLIIPIWKSKGHATRHREIQRNNSAESYYEITREDSG